MATTRPFRCRSDYLSALLVFVGMTALLVAHAGVFNGYDGWLFLTAIVGMVLGGILQQRRTPEPIQSVTAPKAIRWPLYVALMVSVIVLPRVDWHGLWLVVMFLMAATTGALTSVVSVHTQKARQQQDQRETNTAAGNIPHDTDSTKNIPEA